MVLLASRCNCLFALFHCAERGTLTFKIIKHHIQRAGPTRIHDAYGETFVIHPEEILVAMDTTATRDKWRLIDDQPWKRAYIAFKEGTNINFRADDAQPKVTNLAAPTLFSRSLP
jgi:ribosomal protein L23